MKRRLRRWGNLPAGERWLLIRAIGPVVVMRVALSVIPFRVLHKSFKPRVSSRKQQWPVERQAWAVRKAARLVPAASCLTQALALKWLLARSGYESTIQVGVNLAEGGRFTAHAWVEREDRIILGAEEAGRYARLLAW